MTDLNTKINTATMLMAAIHQATEDEVLDEMIGWYSDSKPIIEFVDALEWAIEQMRKKL